MKENFPQPYAFQSGRYKGRPVEEIIFEDPNFVGILLDHRERDKPANALHEHLDVLLDSFPKTSCMCPVCHRRAVKYFLFLNNETVSSNLICCEDPNCQAVLRRNHPNDYLFPIKLSSLFIFKKHKTLRGKVISLFKKIIGLRGKPKADQVFDIFCGKLISKRPLQLQIHFS